MPELPEGSPLQPDHALAGTDLRRAKHSHLSSLNRQLIEAICTFLGIRTRLSTSSDYTLKDGKTERLIDLCLQAGGTEYVSGPAARDYIDETLFTRAGVELQWFSYDGYAPYPQLWGEFVHGVSILDLLFNCGHDAPRFMRYVQS